jgi:vacuolar-type H+-ATPase subunit E/Vma4
MEKIQASGIIEKILGEAESEVAKIKAQGQSALVALKADYADKLAEYKTQSQQMASGQADDKKTRMLAAARMEAAKEILAVKRGALEEVFKITKQKITALPDIEYRALMGSVMKRAADKGDEEVVAGRNENRINASFLSEVNSQLGSKGNLKLADQKGNFDLGFMLVRGKTRVNCSLDALLEEANGAMETEVAGMVL